MYEIPVAQAMPVLRGFENGQVEGVPRSGQVPRTAILTSLCPRRKLESEEVSRIDRGTLFCPEARPGRLSRECPAHHGFGRLSDWGKRPRRPSRQHQDIDGLL